MENKVEVISKINGYSLDDLKSFLQEKVISFSEMQGAGLRYDKQQEIEKWQEEVKRKEKEEQEYWKAVCEANTKADYNRYLKKYPNGQFVGRAKLEIDRIEEEEEEAIEIVIQDMKINPGRYNGPMMASLSRGLEMRFKDGKVVLAEELKDGEEADKKINVKITDELLVEKGIVPDDTNLLEAVKVADFSLPQPKINELGQFPLNRTDIYLLGVPRAGKSCVLAGMIYYAHKKEGRLEYIRQFNEERIDNCEPYYWGLINAIGVKKVPVSTDADTVCFMKVDLINGERKNPLTLVEISGECFEVMADAHGTKKMAWEGMGAKECLDNNNEKMLLFIIDYNIERGGRKEYSKQRQQNILNNALNVFKSDGEGENGEKKCTMSKVDTVVVVITKSDLMGIQDKQQRDERAMEYLKEEYKGFMNGLARICKQYGCNASNKNMPFVTTFSLGKFYVGNTVEYNPLDSSNLVNLLREHTKCIKDR